MLKRITGEKDNREKPSKNEENEMPEENGVATELESLRNILYGVESYKVVPRDI